MSKHYNVQLVIQEVTEETISKGGGYRDPKTDEKVRTHSEILRLNTQHDTLDSAVKAISLHLGIYFGEKTK